MRAKERSHSWMPGVGEGVAVEKDVKATSFLMWVETPAEVISHSSIWSFIYLFVHSFVLYSLHYCRSPSVVFLSLFWPLSRLSSAALTMTFLCFSVIHKIKCRLLSTASKASDLVSSYRSPSCPAASHWHLSKLQHHQSLKEAGEMPVGFASILFCVLAPVF